MLRFLPERPDDAEEIETLLDLSFAPGRTALSSYQLREGVAPIADLCRVVRDEYDTMAAAIRYWPVRLGHDRLPGLLLGPIAVHPTRQGEGIGAALMADTLGDAERLGWTRVLLVGDEPYYRRFGFTRAAAGGLVFPPPVNPARLLGRGLAPDAMAGLAGPVTGWDPAG